MPAKCSPPNEGGERIAPLAKLPIFWNLSNKRTVVAGGSEGAAWKAELLIACGAKVELYCMPEELGETMRSLVTRGVVTFHQHPWHCEIFRGAAMALADCETDAEARAFSCAAAAAGVPVNVIDKPRYCQFQFGSIVNRSPVIVSISTDGAAPILAQAIRQRIEALLPPALRHWAALAHSVRETVNRRLTPGPQRRLFWERFVSQGMLANDPPPDDLADHLITEVEQIAPRPVSGSIVLVGAGPGDPELVTLKAMRALQAADVILFDEAVSPGVLELARREARRLAVAKRGGITSCRDEETRDMMLLFAKNGQRVVRLRVGDPMIHNGAEDEIARLRREGVDVDVIPGVTAGMAAQMSHVASVPRFRNVRRCAS